MCVCGGGGGDYADNSFETVTGKTVRRLLQWSKQNEM